MERGSALLWHTAPETCLGRRTITRGGDCIFIQHPQGFLSTRIFGNVPRGQWGGCVVPSVGEGCAHVLWESRPGGGAYPQ